MSDLLRWLTFFLLNASWQLCALLLVAACLLRLLPDGSKLLRHRLWVSCLLLALALPCTSASLALMPPHSRTPARSSADPLRWRVPQPPPESRLALHLTEVPSAPSTAPRALVTLYLGSLLFGYGRLLFRLLRTRALVRRASLLELSPDIHALLDQGTRLLRIPQARLLVSAELQGAATVTWPIPLILVPPSFSSLPESEAAAILAHELAHVRRRDFASNLALEALAVPLLFHPATPWLKRRIAESREFVCDELAANATSGPSAYARALVAVAHRSAGWSSAHAGVSIGIAGITDLERRVMHLVRAPRPLSKPRRLLLNTLTLAVLSAASLAAVLLSLHPPPVHAAGVPLFPFDPTQTFDSLTPDASRKPAPDFTLVDNHGRTITLSDYKGKVVLLDFWATWCGGCKLEIPWYMEFDRKYRAEGLAVIGVSMDEKGWSVVRPFLAKRKDDETGRIIAMQYPVVIGNEALASRFGLTSMPMTLLIDRSGRIAVAHTGVVDKGNFENNLRTLLH